MKKYEYRVISSLRPEFGVVTYGLSVRTRQGAQTAALHSVEDLSSDREAVARLAERCQRLQLSPVHLMDVAEDFLL